MPGHLCPYGLKTVDLLKREGFAVEDHHLETRAQTDAFKTEHDVATTPQIFIDGQRIGGYDDLREYLGKSRSQPEEGETSYPFRRTVGRHREKVHCCCFEGPTGRRDRD